MRRGVRPGFRIERAPLRVSVIIVVVALAAVACSRRATTETKKTEEAAPTGDNLVIEQLRRAGADLSKPQDVEFFLYLPTKEAASHVATAMSRDGYATEVRPPVPDIPQWSCIAKKSIVVTPGGMAEIRARLTELAARNGGEYDGWGSGITK